MRRRTLGVLLTAIRNLDMWESVPACSYGSNERRPFHAMNIYVVKSGHWERLTTVETPWITPPTEETGLPGWRPGHQ